MRDTSLATFIMVASAPNDDNTALPLVITRVIASYARSDTIIITAGSSIVPTGIDDYNTPQAYGTACYMMAPCDPFYGDEIMPLPSLQTPRLNPIVTAIRHAASSSSSLLPSSVHHDRDHGHDTIQLVIIGGEDKSPERMEHLVLQPKTSSTSLTLVKEEENDGDSSSAAPVVSSSDYWSVYPCMLPIGMYDRQRPASGVVLHRSHAVGSSTSQLHIITGVLPPGGFDGHHIWSSSSLSSSLTRHEFTSDEWITVTQSMDNLLHNSHRTGAAWPIRRAYTSWCDGTRIAAIGIPHRLLFVVVL